MNEAERQRLKNELSEICLVFHPTKGEHTIEDITQRFDHYQMAVKDRYATENAGALEYGATRNLEHNPQDINNYFQDKERYADRQVQTAYEATCRANGLTPIRQYGDGDGDEAGENTPRHRPDDAFIARHTGGGDGNDDPTGGGASPAAVLQTTPVPDWMRQGPKRNGPSL